MCRCLDEVQTLISLRMFPATPNNPRLVFLFELFDLLESLFLDCQLPIEDFVTALYHNFKLEVCGTILFEYYTILLEQCFIVSSRNRKF